MGRKKLLRLVAAGMALVCLVCTVAALSFDLSGDGRTDVWDLQLAVNQDKTELYDGALSELLGGENELQPNADGVYEIYSPVGLYNMARRADEGATFRLMADIDLKGAAWTPVDCFKGDFQGQGYRISNLKITQASNGNMGFFGLVDHKSAGVSSTVKDLRLENVTVVADQDSRYIGLVAGSNRGIIENCTAVGSITDQRTSLSEAVYIGALVGRNNNSAPAGKLVRGQDLLTVTAGSSNAADKVEGVSAKVAMFFQPLQEGSQTRQVGIAGYSAEANLDTAMIWQDTTGSLTYRSQKEQQNRQVAVDEMYQMGSIRWTPSETVTFTRNGSTTHVHSNAFIAGKTYIGLPYVGGYNGSYERFLSQLQPEKDDLGRYVTVTGLEDGIKNADGTVLGFIRYMGNNCSCAVGWSWAALSPARTQNGYGGVQGFRAEEMVPTAANTESYGVYPVGGYQMPGPEAANKGKQTRDAIALNGDAQGMAEYYALAGRGDALVFVNYDYDADGNASVGAHVRLLAYEPVIIRDYKNGIDLERSYVITHEQGDGLFDNRIDEDQNYEKYQDEEGRTFSVKASSWRLDHKYTLAVLLTEQAFNEQRANGYQGPDSWPGCGWGYIPVTISAYTADTQKAPYYNKYSGDNTPVLPSKGWYYSNYWNISATMTITDAAGQTVYEETAFLLDRNNSGFQNIKLELEFPEAVQALTSGQTYYCTLTALASNGTVTTIENNTEFIYE